MTKITKISSAASHTAMWQVAFQFGAEQDPITSVRRCPCHTAPRVWVAFEGQRNTEGEQKGEKGIKDYRIQHYRIVGYGIQEKRNKEKGKRTRNATTNNYVDNTILRSKQIRYILPPRMRDHFDLQTMMYLLNSKVQSGWEGRSIQYPSAQTGKLSYHWNLNFNLNLNLHIRLISLFPPLQIFLSFKCCILHA